jgi:hypothetical protein
LEGGQAQQAYPVGGSERFELVDRALDQPGGGIVDAPPGSQRGAGQAARLGSGHELDVAQQFAQRGGGHVAGRVAGLLGVGHQVVQHVRVGPAPAPGPVAQRPQPPHQQRLHMAVPDRGGRG